VLEIVKAFDKVSDPSKISATSSFQNDLGLDSLDTVEVVMAIEEEFSVEIPVRYAWIRRWKLTGRTRRRMRSSL
jgi:NADH dehydrogenase (ubiquinone) 1 alpha/beta subcomplex 1